MSIIKKLAGETAVYGVSSIVGRFLNYLLVPLYTGLFHSGEYGVSSLFYSYASFVAVVFTYGMETAFFRYYHKHKPGEVVYSTAMISVLSSSLVLGAMIVLFATPLANWSDNAHREMYFRYFAVVLTADAISTIPFAWLRQQKKALKFASLRLLSIGTNISINLFFYLLCPFLLEHGYGWIRAVYNPGLGITYMFVANVMSSIVVLPFFGKEYRLMRFGFDRVLWKEMFIYAFPLIFMGFAGMINETIDRILLKYLIPNKPLAEIQVGIYSANYKLSILITLFVQAFRFAAEPFFFARAKEQDARQTYAMVMRYFIIVCSLIFLLVMLYLDIFKYFIRTREYWAGLNVVPILLMANLFLGVYYNLSIWYKITDKTKLGAVVSIIGALITLILNFWWIPLFGYMGSAWATLVCYFSMALISYVLGHKYYPVPYETGKILLYIGLALGLYEIAQLIDPLTGDSFALKMLIHTGLFLAYPGMLLLFFERQLLRMFGRKAL